MQNFLKLHFILLCLRLGHLSSFIKFIIISLLFVFHNTFQVGTINNEVANRLQYVDQYTEWLIELFSINKYH